MQSLQDALLNALKSPSPLAYLLVFLGGIIVSLGSCTIIELPVLVGYIGGVGTSSKRRVFTLTFLFILGMLTTYLIIGVAIGLASISLGRMATGSTFLYIGVGGISLVLGMSMLGFLPVPTTGLECLAKLKRGKTDLLGAYLIGMAFIFFEAPTCPACAPALMLISGYMVTKGKVFVGVSLLMTYVLGQSIPLMAAGGMMGWLKELSQRFHRLGEYLRIASGIFLLLVALDLFWLA